MWKSFFFPQPERDVQSCISQHWLGSVAISLTSWLNQWSLLGSFIWLGQPFHPMFLLQGCKAFFSARVAKRSKHWRGTYTQQPFPECPMVAMLVRHVRKHFCVRQCLWSMSVHSTKILCRCGSCNGVPVYLVLAPHGPPWLCSLCITMRTDVAVQIN